MTRRRNPYPPRHDVRDLARSRGLTVAALAEQVGRHRGYVAQCLSGRFPMTEPLAERLSEVLGIDVEPTPDASE